MASPVVHDSITGMSSGEAREFHRIFMLSTILFTGWAFAAHLLVHFWRPWFYNDGNVVVSSVVESVQPVLTAVTSLV